MPKGLNALVIAPMGKGKEKEMPESEESEDGLRETFDEFMEAFRAGDDDAAFEALRNFTDMCAMKAGDY
jgi:hypothetical protein